MAGVLEIWEEQPSAVLDLALRVGVLSGDETARMRRLSKADDRRRFATAWSLTRQVLAELAGTEPGSLRFDRSCRLCGHRSHGKPSVVGGAWRFSISHVGDRVLLAVSDEHEIGVDIESLGRDVGGLAGSILHPSEPAVTGRDLLRVWVAKEAVLKATGSGLAVGMSTFALARPPEQAHVVELLRADDYVAALATLP